MYKITSLIILLTVLVSCNTNAQNSANAQKVLVSAQAFQDSIKLDTAPVVLDVRTEQEFQGGHLKGAININYYGDNFLALCKQYDTSKPVYVYCHSGGRSAGAANKLQKAGFVNIIELKGGITSWKAANLPLE